MFRNIIDTCLPYMFTLLKILYIFMFFYVFIYLMYEKKPAIVVSHSKVIFQLDRLPPLLQTSCSPAREASCLRTLVRAGGLWNSWRSAGCGLLWLLLLVILLLWNVFLLLLLLLLVVGVVNVHVNVSVNVCYIVSCCRRRCCSILCCKCVCWGLSFAGQIGRTVE